MPVPPAMSGLERTVMEHVWARPGTSVRDVLEALNDDPSRSPRAYTTVLTVMQRLQAKGLVTGRRDGRADVFEATIGRDAYLRARAAADVDELVEQYGELALAQFARRAAALDPARRDALRRLAEEE